MLFKHPEVLYALFLLVIPVLVHLFRLRRFRPEKFTNVRFLKKAISQTRRSSRLKKWLILFIRLLLLACVIIAFAQPYLPPAAGEVKPQEIVIYLDNSYSMQAKGKKGILLKRAVQDLLESLPETGEFSFFTNDSEFYNISAEALKNELWQLKYANEDPDWETITLKARNFFSKGDKQRQFVAISDFQQDENEIEDFDIAGVTVWPVQMKPESINNFSIDTVFLTEKSLEESVLTVEISSSGEVPLKLPVALYDGSTLLAKKTIQLEEEKASTSFRITDESVPEGRIVIDDSGLQFDNEIFFSLIQADPVQVVSIGNAEDSFLQRIFKAPEFEFLSFPENNINFSKVSDADLIILNEVEEVSPSLASALRKMLQENSFLTVIPSENAAFDSYNSLLRSLGIAEFQPVQKQELLVTHIAFNHPLYASVFNEEVENFDYPRVQKFYESSTSKKGILEYENGQPFLFQSGNVFVFTAPLNMENSNFQNSALIVPTFFNIGNMAVPGSQLYYTLGGEEEITVQSDLGQDEILKLSSGEASFIPRQQNFGSKVELYLEDLPEEPGHYEIAKDSEKLGSLSFNISRQESEMNYPHLPESLVSENIPQVFAQMQERNEVHALWKWFLIFALFFLLCELLILKFFK